MLVIALSSTGMVPVSEFRQALRNSCSKLRHRAQLGWDGPRQRIVGKLQPLQARHGAQLDRDSPRQRIRLKVPVPGPLRERERETGGGRGAAARVGPRGAAAWRLTHRLVMLVSALSSTGMVPVSEFE